MKCMTEKDALSLDVKSHSDVSKGSIGLSVPEICQFICSCLPQNI